MFSANDRRDLELVASGRTAVGDANAAVARCLLALSNRIVAMEGLMKTMREERIAPVEESVTPDSPMAVALMSPVLEPEVPTVVMDEEAPEAPKSKKKKGG